MSAIGDLILSLRIGQRGKKENDNRIMAHRFFALLQPMESSSLFMCLDDHTLENASSG